MVVDHGLVGAAVFGAAQEEAAVRAEVVPHLEGDLEVAERLVGEDDAAVAGDVLAAHDGAVLHHPAAGRLVLAGGRVARLRARVPAGEGLAVEERLKALVSGGGEGGEADENEE